MNPASLAAYIDGVTRGDERARAEAHFAECAECREELASVAALVAATPKPAGRGVRLLLPLAVAAALLLFLLPRTIMLDDARGHREPAVVTAKAPGILEPVGPVAKAPGVAWSLVPGASRYRVTLYDSTGAVLWEAATSDTALALPASIALRRDTPYFWRVHARTGFDRWAESSLVEFRLTSSP